MPLGPAALPALIQDSTAQTSEVESLRGWFCWLSAGTVCQSEHRNYYVIEEGDCCGRGSGVIRLAITATYVGLGKMFLHVVGLFDALFKLGLDKL